MSICIIAMVVLGVLGIFSAKYRRWAREAMACVSRRITLRPCNTTFNEKVKSKLVSKLMGRSRKIAAFTYSHFETISWIFTIAFFISLGFTIYSVYNLAVFGTCDPSDPGSCVFTTGATCSPAEHCTPCVCDSAEISCDNPAYDACEGDCDCTEICSSVS